MIRLRIPTDDDAPALTDLVWHSKASNGYDDAFMEACRDELSVTRASLHTGHWWLVESDRLLGCCQLTIAANVGTVSAFFIAPDVQGRGIGRHLWSRLHAEAVELQLARLELDADPAAVGFYEQLGFLITGSVPSGSIPGRRLPRMTFNLPVG